MSVLPGSRSGRRQVSGSLPRRGRNGNDAGIAVALAPPDYGAFIEHLRAQARFALAILSATEARVVRLRYGIGIPTPASVVQTARRLGLPNARVRQIEANALRKLRYGGIRRGSE